ncbi:MAG: dicarboxylate/amino acid:cation symporter [Thiohalophilus sp.]|jgi:Na+/H+-dicarboxylate symporter
MLNGLFVSLEQIHPRNIKYLTSSLTRLIHTRLWLQVLVALILGVITGILLSPHTGWLDHDTAYTIGEWLALPGKIFLAFIQMIVVPLILASIIRGIAAASDIQQLKATGLWLGIYFIGTTIAAVIFGIVLGLTLKPGSYVDAKALMAETPSATVQAQSIEKQVDEYTAEETPLSLQTVPEKVTGLLPTNPISSIVEGDMLQIVIFAIVIGIGLLSLSPDSSRPLLDLFGSIQSVCMAVVGAAMTLAPLAVFGLLAQAMIKAGPQVITGLGVYSASVIIGMAVLMVFYLLIVVLIARRSGLAFLRAAREPFLMAFSTDSSAATMPITAKSAEEDLKVRPSLVQFIVPLGATVNMCGTALYQGLATIFMAQMFQIDLPLTALLALVVTAVGASIGTPAVPGVGIIVLATLLSSVGIPLTGLALIIGVDRFLERFRASLNVTGDLVACVIMDRYMPASQSKETEIQTQQQLEAQRNPREDVVIQDTSS